MSRYFNMTICPDMSKYVKDILDIFQISLQLRIEGVSLLYDFRSKIQIFVGMIKCFSDLLESHFVIKFSG